MAIALISSSAPATNAVSATTSAIDTTGANLLVIQMACNDPHTDTPTDSKGNTWTQLTSYTQTNVRVRTWYSVPTSVGSGHTFTSNGASFFGTILASAWSGVNATPTDLISGSNGFANTLQPGSITPSQNDCLILTHVGINATGGTPISINGGFTELGEVDYGTGDHYGGCFAYLIQTTATASNPTWTRTGTNGMACTQHSWKAASASGPTTVKTINGLAIASVKTINGLAIASVKSVNGAT